MENENVRSGGDKVFKVVASLVAVAAIVVAGYFYSQLRTLKENPQAMAQQEVAQLVSKVGRLVVLPQGETPTVATVSDPEALKDQPFFAQAMKGDKVLIYPQAKKAFLFSVVLNKLLDVAPLNIGSQRAVTPPATTSSQ